VFRVVLSFVGWGPYSSQPLPNPPPMTMGQLLHEIEFILPLIVSVSGARALYIARQLVLGKFEGQNQVLSKYGLKRHDFSIVEKVRALDSENISRFRAQLMSIEGHFSEKYFDQILGLIPEPLRPDRRKTFKAYDGVNNIFNLAYEILSWKVQHALIKTKLEPYLGFLHSMAKGKPSLICDFMELYRYLTDEFVIQYCRNLQKKDFTIKIENFSTNRKGKREYLNGSQTNRLVNGLNQYFQTKVKIPRIRMGNMQEIETLINEEALLFATHLRNSKQTWTPRIPLL
jgi:CRISPR-associated endonuclease Cas1